MTSALVRGGGETMNKPRNGFTLIDTLIAMLIVLTGSAVVIEVSAEANRHWHAHRERLIAREILGRLAYLPIEELAAWDERGYDALGRPSKGDRPPVFRLRVEPHTGFNWTTYTCTLLYEDDDGRPRVLSLMRKAWHRDV
jgi:hypothetical protein